MILLRDLICTAMACLLLIGGGYCLERLNPHTCAWCQSKLDINNDIDECERGEGCRK